MLTSNKNSNTNSNTILNSKNNSIESNNNKAPGNNQNIIEINSKKLLLSYSRVEVFIALIFVIFYTIFGTLLYYNYKDESFISNTQRLGTLIVKENIAQRRLFKKVAWVDATNKIPIYNKDTFRTDEKSYATLILNDVTEINLEEKSLIFVELLNKNVLLNLKNGNLEYNNNGLDNNEAIFNNENNQKNESNSVNENDTQKTQLHLGNDTITLDKGILNATYNSSSNKTLLNIKEGNVNLTTRTGEQLKLSENTNIEVSIDKIEKNEVQIKLLSPKNGQIYYSKNNIQFVTFFWEKNTEVKNLNLEISNDPQFAEKIKTISIENLNSISLPLKLNTYYWRIKYNTTSNNQQFNYSNVNRFIINSLDPKVNLEVYSELTSGIYKTILGDKTPVNFIWKKIEQASSYTIEVSKTANFKSIYKKINTLQNNISIPLINDKYYYRIKVNLLGQNSAIESGVMAVDIIQEKEIQKDKDLVILEGGKNIHNILTSKNIKIDIDNLIKENELLKQKRLKKETEAIDKEKEKLKVIINESLSNNLSKEKKLEFINTLNKKNNFEDSKSLGEELDSFIEYQKENLKNQKNNLNSKNKISNKEKVKLDKPNSKEKIRKEEKKFELKQNQTKEIKNVEIIHKPKFINKIQIYYPKNDEVIHYKDGKLSWSDFKYPIYSKYFIIEFSKVNNFSNNDKSKNKNKNKNNNDWSNLDSEKIENETNKNLLQYLYSSKKILENKLILQKFLSR